MMLRGAARSSGDSSATGPRWSPRASWRRGRDTGGAVDQQVVDGDVKDLGEVGHGRRRRRDQPTGLPPVPRPTARHRRPHPLPDVPESVSTTFRPPPELHHDAWQAFRSRTHRPADHPYGIIGHRQASATMSSPRRLAPPTPGRRQMLTPEGSGAVRPSGRSRCRRHPGPRRPPHRRNTPRTNRHLHADRRIRRDVGSHLGDHFRRA